MSFSVLNCSFPSHSSLLVLGDRYSKVIFGRIRPRRLVIIGDPRIQKRGGEKIKKMKRATSENICSQIIMLLVYGDFEILELFFPRCAPQLHVCAVCSALTYLNRFGPAVLLLVEEPLGTRAPDSGGR